MSFIHLNKLLYFESNRIDSNSKRENINWFKLFDLFLIIFKFSLNPYTLVPLRAPDLLPLEQEQREQQEK